MGSILTFWFVCILIMAFCRGLKKQKLDKLKFEDPEKWARIVAAEDARKRSMAGGALKIARIFLKR